jgi:hypothetical protein
MAGEPQAQNWFSTVLLERMPTLEIFFAKKPKKRKHIMFHRTLIALAATAVLATGMAAKYIDK